MNIRFIFYRHNRDVAPHIFKDKEMPFVPPVGAFIFWPITLGSEVDDAGIVTVVKDVEYLIQGGEIRIGIESYHRAENVEDDNFRGLLEYGFKSVSQEND